MARKLISGGRDLRPAPWVFSRLADYIQPWDVLIVGDATGADAIAAEFAYGLGCEVMRFAADWELHGRGAGPLRNQRMIDEGKPEVAAFFPGGRGTADMFRRCQAAKIDCYTLRKADALLVQPRDGRSPIERMIDEACGVALSASGSEPPKP
jgi:hypothetical protein